MEGSNDHDILVRIETIVSMNQENFVKHCEQDAEAQGVLFRSVSALHRRIDWLMVSGVLAIVLVVATAIVRFSMTHS